MKTFKEYIAERVLSVGFEPAQEINREKYGKEIFDILSRSYRGVNPDNPEEGYGGLISGSKEETEAIDNDISSSLIKATKRNGKITSVNLYKDKFGRKSIASGTDGTPQGKSDYIRNKAEDITHKRAWAEVSGKAGHIAKRLGAPTVPNSFAKHLTGKNDVETNDDDETYTRKIGPNKHTKFIVGYPKL